MIDLISTSNLFHSTGAHIVHTSYTHHTHITHITHTSHTHHTHIIHTSHTHHTHIIHTSYTIIGLSKSWSVTRNCIDKHREYVTFIE